MKNRKLWGLVLALSIVIVMHEGSQAKAKSITINQESRIVFSQYGNYLEAISDNQSIGLIKVMNAGLLTMELKLVSWLLKKSSSQWQCSIDY